MIDIDKRQILSFLLIDKYINEETYHTDFRNAPRPFSSLAILNEGSARIHSDGKIIEVHKDDVLFIPKYAVYAGDWIAADSVQVFSIHFDFQPLPDPFRNRPASIQTMKVSDIDALKKIYESLYTQRNTGSDAALLADFFRYLSTVLPLIRTDTSTPGHDSIQPAIDYIESHYTDPLTVEELAALCSLSPSRFFTKFKEATGTPPIAYKNRIWIHHVAQSILSENKSIEEIAEEYRFSSAIYLRRLFKNTFKTSPTQYKKENERIL